MPIRRRSFIPMISQNIHAIYSVPTYILAKCVPWTLANLCTYIFTEKNTHLLWNGELSLYGWPDVRLVWIQYLCLLTFKSTYLPIMSKPLKQEAICTVIGTSPFKFKENSVIFLWISTIIWFRITQSIVYALLYWDSSILRWNMVNDLLQQTSFFKYGPNPASFCLFSSLTQQTTNKIQNLLWSRRCCVWELDLGPKDCRRR